MKEGGVGLAIDEYTEILPAEIIEEIHQKRSAGELTIERYPGVYGTIS